MINTLSEQELSDIKEISHKALDLIAILKQAKNKTDLLEAGKNLSGINYSLLGIMKEHEMEVINILNQSMENK